MQEKGISIPKNTYLKKQKKEIKDKGEHKVRREPS